MYGGIDGWGEWFLVGGYDVWIFEIFWYCVIWSYCYDVLFGVEWCVYVYFDKWGVVYYCYDFLVLN